MSKARRQHFIPISYLERFSAKGELHATDLIEKKVFKTSPANVANIRDFYSVDHTDETKQNVIENYFAQTEGSAKPILDRWIRTMEPPTPKEWYLISEFIAGMSLRTPEFRKKYLELAQYMMDLMVHSNFSSKEAYDKYCVRYQQETNKELELEYDEIKQVCDNPNLFQIVLHQNEYIIAMMHCIAGIAQIISKMTPVLFVGRGRHRFIVSDNPVILIDGDRTKPPWMGTGWLTKTVEAYFPISPLTCIVLMWDKEYMVVPTNEKFIPSVNSYQLWYSTRYVYSESDNIFWCKGGRIHQDRDLLFKEFSDCKLKNSSTVHGPILQVDRPFDLRLIRKSSYPA